MKKYFFFLKLVLLCLIFFWIFKSVDTKDALSVLKKTNFLLFFTAFVLNNLSNIILTIKWQRLTNPLKIKSGFLELLKLNYISIFYSSFIPGQSSGELIKGLKLTQKEGATQKVWMPIFVDKITNFLIVLIIGFIAILSDNVFRKNLSLMFIVSFLTVSFLLLTVILFSEDTEQFIAFLKKILIKTLTLFKINTDRIKDFSLTYLNEYKKHRLLMAETLIWSLLTKLPHIFSFHFLALSLNMNLTILQCMWLFSIVSVVTLLPISFSGLGVREGTVITLLSQINIERSNSLSFSILIFMVGILTALVGGILELFSELEIARKPK